MSGTIRTRKSVDTWVPVILIDDDDFKTPKTGIVFGGVTTKYACDNDTTLQTLTMSATNWRELGRGLYEIKFTSTEKDANGEFKYVAEVADCLPYYGLLEIVDETADTDTDNIQAILADTGTDGVIVATNNDKTGYSISGTITTLDALDTALDAAHGAGSWATAVGFSTHSAADVWAVVARTITGGTIDTNNDKAGYGLADAAITSAKYDSSTAFPVAYTDSGDTTIARKGAGAHSLSTLNAAIGALNDVSLAQMGLYYKRVIPSAWDGAGHATAGTVKVYYTEEKYDADNPDYTLTFATTWSGATTDGYMTAHGERKD
jgi:hypothetical protein